DPIRDEVSHTMRERIGLAGAGSSDNEKRTSLGVVRPTVLHSGFLLGIKIKVCSAHECAWCESNKEHIRAGHLSGSVIEAVAMCSGWKREAVPARNTSIKLLGL